MSRRRNQGQGLIEAMLLLPLLLLLVYGTYVCIRATSLDSAAEGAAHAEAIRSGRRLAGIEHEMSDSILPAGKGVQIHAESGNNSRVRQLPFSGLAGRTRGTAEIHYDWEDTVSLANLPPLRVGGISEMSVDCWDNPTPSGRKVRTAVRGFVTTGVLR